MRSPTASSSTAFTTERYVREATLPGARSGLAKLGPDRATPSRSRAPVRRDRAHGGRARAARKGARQQIAFYGSTPAYRAVLELHGWGDLQTELNGLARRGAWEEMGGLVTDDVLDTFAIVCDEPDGVAAAVARRYGGLVDRTSLSVDGDIDPDWFDGVRVALQAL